MFKRTVVGCKDSLEGSDAVALGAAVASATGAGLSLVCVYPTWSFPVPGSSDRATFLAEAEATLRRERDSQAPHALIDAVAIPSSRVRCGITPRAGMPAWWWSGPTPRRPRVRLRSADEVASSFTMRRSTLALARRDLHKQGVKLRRIGVGYDGGPEAQAALAFAAELGRVAGSTLAIHSVVEDRFPAFTGNNWFNSIEGDQMWEGKRQLAEAEAEKAVSLLDVSTEVTSAVGDPGLEMRELSRRVDLVVVGSRRWGPVARLVSGSVGETLVSEAHCSIMIVPRPPVAGAPRIHSLIGEQTPV